MDDLGLVIANANSAKQAGAIFYEQFEVQSFIYSKKQKISGFHGVQKGKKRQILAKQILNTTGSWTNQLYQKAHINNTTALVSPTKGVHLVLPNMGLKQACILEHPQDQRIFFVIPWQNKTLVGTTDTPYTGHPDAVCVATCDVDYLFEGFYSYFSASQLTKKDILDRFVGLRPLAYSNSSASYRKRDFVLHRCTQSDLVSLYGGKYTTYRAMAEHTVDYIIQKNDFSGLKPCETAMTLLP